MSSYAAVQRKRAASPSPLPTAFLALVAGFGLFILLLAGVVIAFNMMYADQVYPGISVAGVDLSGMEPEEAAARLAQNLVFPQNGKIAFEESGQFWIASPADLGLILDPQTSAMAAYRTGRQGNPILRLITQFEAWYSGKDLPPLLVYDERMAQRYVEGMAAQINRPTVEASLQIDGLDVVVKPGQIGRTVDVAATLAPLEGQMRSLTDGLLPVVVYETAPAILDVSQQADLARQILSKSLVLQLPDAGEGDPGPWTFAPEKLVEMLTIQRVESAEGARYQVGLETEQLRKFLVDLAPKLSRAPENARFIFNDETRQLDLLQNAVIGRSLDVESTIQRINETLIRGEHQVELVMNVNPPQVTDDVTAVEMGITELVHQETSYFYGSDKARVQNIKTASSRFHGVMVPPGATFSMAEYLGDVSLDTGYAEAWIIYGNRTIKGVGGGVCQVSTTLFRTVFFGGFPVVERHPHAYRVGYYEQNAGGGYNTNLAGLDATVYVPMVDFKFKNDTPYWLLMETYINGYSLTWKFYSTSDGRSVNWDTTGLRNVQEPPEPQYIENPDLDKGQIKQVDWEVKGADVTVERTVLRNGEVYISDQYTTHYIPWRSIFEYGPGTKLPKEARD